MGGGGLSYGGYGLYLKPAIFKFIAFALNQPSPTNQLQFFPTLCNHHLMKRLLPVLMGFALLLLSSTEGWSLPRCPTDSHISTWTDCFGIWTVSSGDWAGFKYVGEFRDGKKHGQGTHTFSASQGDVEAAVSDALDRGVLGFDAVKHLLLCRIEKRPPRLDLMAYPFLPHAEVATTSTRSYMGLLTGGAS